jgi:hypothetical protein
MLSIVAFSATVRELKKNVINAFSLGSVSVETLSLC